jgi:hypothetical protein
VQHSQTAEALPLTFIAVEGEQLLGTIGLWRCDLISRQDLFPGWRRCTSRPPLAVRGWPENCSGM